jgi:hypothetical protein
MSTQDIEPQEPTFVSLGESRYNGRSFYAGQGMTSADQAAELHYLRDWKTWAEKRLQPYRAIELNGELAVALRGLFECGLLKDWEFEASATERQYKAMLLARAALVKAGAI